MLSTYHTNETMNKRTRRANEGTETIRKQVVVNDYNSYMGGVDKSDQLVLYYVYTHRW